LVIVVLTSRIKVGIRTSTLSEITMTTPAGVDAVARQAARYLRADVRSAETTTAIQRDFPKEPISPDKLPFFFDKRSPIATVTTRHHQSPDHRASRQGVE
jgi:hypothetical protein